MKNIDPRKLAVVCDVHICSAHTIHERYCLVSLVPKKKKFHVFGESGHKIGIAYLLAFTNHFNVLSFFLFKALSGL